MLVPFLPPLTKRTRYVLAVLMSTVAEKQKVSLAFDSETAAAGYFKLSLGDGPKTATIPYDAVRTDPLYFPYRQVWLPSSARERRVAVGVARLSRSLTGLPNHWN